MIRTNRAPVPLCQTSCSKLSSKTMTFPSSHDLKRQSKINRGLKIQKVKNHYLVSSATLRYVFFGTTRPKWLLNLQLVGPQWGHTWVFGNITLNLACPLVQVAAGGKAPIKEHVIGALLQLACLLPRKKRSNCFQSPVSFKFSASSLNGFAPFAFSKAKPSARIFCQLSSKFL